VPIVIAATAARPIRVAFIVLLLGDTEETLLLGIRSENNLGEY
jgi:hypothetical protein